MKHAPLIVVTLVALGAPGRSSQGQDLSQIFRRVSPSVVIVRTAETAIPNWPGAPPSLIGALGSGVLISADGKVLTAAHVVQTAEKVVVEFANGELVSSSKNRSVSVPTPDASRSPSR